MKRVTNIDQLRPGIEVMWCRKIITRRAGAPPYYDPYTAACYDEEPIDLQRGVVLALEPEEDIVRLRQRRQRVPLRLIWAVRRY